MVQLTKREKIWRAIRQREPGNIPWNIEMTAGFAEQVRTAHPEAAPDIVLGNHMLRGKYKNNHPCSNGDSIDLFGVRWHPSQDGGDVGIVAEYPLAQADGDFGDYHFPEIDLDFADGVCDALEAETQRFTMFSITMGFFERAWSLRGMENALVDMLADPEFAQEMYSHIFDHHMALLDRVLDRSFDALYFGDDWGQQNGLIMGPDLWRQFIKPGVSKIFDRAKRKGKAIVLHSCGDLREIIPDLIEMGVDVYNTVQPEIYDLKALKREYGKDICFYGGISTQQFLPYATPAEVRAKTCEVLDIMQNGGYILSPTHAVTPDIPVENIMAMIEASGEV